MPPPHFRKTIHWDEYVQYVYFALDNILVTGLRESNNGLTVIRLDIRDIEIRREAPTPSELCSWCLSPAP